MAARKVVKRLDDKWREKIKHSMLVTRLRKHAAGEIEMTTTQVRAAEILLKKVLPDLKSTDMQVTDNTDYSEILAAARKRAGK